MVESFDIACIIHTMQQQNNLQVIYTKIGEYLSGLLRSSQ